ncbi:MAG: cysteine--tRNA ligase [Candidatus Omnitrophota bacterium]
MQIYNTLTRKKEEFKAIEDGRVNMYVCGPTVYDMPHIGHVRSAYVFDVIRRYLEHAGYKVIFVRNVTDIDDKIINKAVSELRENREDLTALKEKVKEIAIKYLNIYHEQLDLFGILEPTYEPKATENIADMITFIEKIIEKGYAYVVGGDVYFSVDKFNGYGKLSNRNKEEMIEGARVEVRDSKKYPLDFALWKSAKPDEPSWKSPWGDGRPGWHIECSVMSTGILSEEFDIHGGGLDLIFPHHENEIAQAEAATGKGFAKYWMHNGLLTVNGEKMSKSLGNYITITDFLGKHEDTDVLKIAFLNSNYRSPVDYTDDKMEASKTSKERIKTFFKKAMDYKGVHDRIPRVVYGKKTEDLREKFKNAMNDDFNTPLAMSVIFEAVKKGNEALAEGKDDALTVSVISDLRDLILEVSDIFGLSFSEESIDDGFRKEIDLLVRKRETARKNRDFGNADKIRDELIAKGVTVEDTSEGPVWRKK